MKFFPLFIFLPLFFQPPFVAMADKKLIENICKATPSYKLCLSTLLSNPKSLNGDVTDLGLIMISATKSKASQAIQLIKTIYGSHPELRHSLNECTQMYRAVVRADVPSAIQALNGGQPKFAEDGMADTAVEAQACERGLNEHGRKSPLTEMNKVVGEIANVARAIIRMLL